MNTRRRWMAVTALCATLGSGAFVLMGTRPEMPVLPRATAATQPSLQRVALDGADVARLLRLNAYKWTYQLPDAPGFDARRVALTVWFEEWHRASPQPKITQLCSVGLFGGDAQDERTLAIKLPSEGATNLVIDNGSSLVVSPTPGLQMSGPLSSAAAERENLAFGRDVILVALAHNASGFYSGDYKAPDFTRRNDRTVLLKARFSLLKPGQSTPHIGSPTWSGGKIVFK